MIEKIFVLLVIYQIKHFLADFPLQGEYMLKKFEEGWSFVLPLAAHSGVHAGFTFAIALAFTRSFVLAVLLAGFDFVVHFTMDRIKAGKKYLGKFKPLTAKECPSASALSRRHNTYFWWAIGLDQTVHHLTHYAIIACIIMH